jgi:hypothetical protein
MPSSRGNCGRSRASAQVRARFPAERAEPGYIEELLRGAVRAGFVETEDALEPDDLTDELGQLANGELRSDANVEMGSAE